MQGEHYAVVRCAGLRWHLEPEAQLTFGRDEECDIRLGHDPEDRLVSRRAGALVGVDHDVLVRNDSRTQPLLLQAFPGPELVLEPLAMASSPQRQVRVVVPGNWGTQYSISIDAARLQRTLNRRSNPGHPSVSFRRPSREGSIRAVASSSF